MGKGDASESCNFLPLEKQYLVMCGILCLWCATSLAYTDADKDAECLLSSLSLLHPPQMVTRGLRHTQVGKHKSNGL
ncbi:uncharacterized protein LACBIDRAFT_317565 [Laccaria bicolor S238N-H82]|uniref:Predicted protein n=1 Tax=Laccaria bicolor (strain S238N-H82 / ATCC MYA-4686) TaxID=486041 RepID=B0E1Y5_LACBS|nr:uncharacterized protein LACBIDRAFT_317565 [Laccaria bicolor S238N-H82]EDQ99147.1 predicted protein [Laccaria bicolor S238N-H82]|eukprot:XP_001890210.1 predicted protein [Laccaria bicolor S238N-H82]